MKWKIFDKSNVEIDQVETSELIPDSTSTDALQLYGSKHNLRPSEVYQLGYTAKEIKVDKTKTFDKLGSMKIGETQTETFFEVEYRYYRYNTGMADNGYFTGRKRCTTQAEAQAWAIKIDLHRNDKLPEDKAEELVDLLIGNPGHFLKDPVNIYSVDTTRMLVSTVDK